MQIHLSKAEIISIRASAVDSFKQEDEGEAFCEEIVGVFEDSDIEVIESRSGGSADEFFAEIFLQWDGIDPSDIMDMVEEALSIIDIDLTYAHVDDDDEVEEDEEEDDDFVEEDWVDDEEEKDDTVEEFDDF